MQEMTIEDVVIKESQDLKILYMSIIFEKVVEHEHELKRHEESEGIAKRKEKNKDEKKKIIEGLIFQDHNRVR